ncbi:hypothetical protein BDY21DRAFT_12635 [Lineolata rhizophorae]|uniref:Peptidase S9 prolyl oligopeptidase catalytic domain-containing protein n=1 Tax=Lineolata rhizophorae TaxID=578093 RepID=A0A6A6PEY1_9PEZI|nr:hypothetical protein BDY21DRAFT_12635 [Lineolata rhizophorae]
MPGLSFRVLSLYIFFLLRPPNAGAQMNQHAVLGRTGVPFSFSPTWQILGPFQIGTREAPWGADPLEYYGGFRSLDFDDEAAFRSSLPSNGLVFWSTVEVELSDVDNAGVAALLTVAFPEIDWSFLQTVYGWAATQFQAWARGEIVHEGPSALPVVLFSDRIIEFWVDGKSYFGGDFYAYRRAPVVLHLEPGRHRLDVRLVRDVRAMGGIGEPSIQVEMQLQPAAGGFELAEDGILMSAAVTGKLVSPWASVSVRNSGLSDLEIFALEIANGSSDLVPLQNFPISVKSGQSRPLAFQFSSLEFNTSSIQIAVKYRPALDHDPISTYVVSQNITHSRSLYNPHKFTFLHPGGIVSYAMIRPPSTNASCARPADMLLPILLQLHGAGVEAESDAVAHALDSVPDICAWVVFPTGVTTWSSDDWHAWGFADVEAAIASLHLWLQSTGWHGVGIDVDRWLVSGHSNGGQGTWYTLAHRPDKVFAAAPVSGYTSIQNYVPYSLWQPADPARTAIVSAALNSYRHEKLAENYKGIPVLQQHGEMDENVPAFHSRLMRKILSETEANSTYVELSGQGHWFDGVMTTDPLRQFYKDQLRNHESRPPLREFSIVVGSPGNMGSKGGVTVEQLDNPGQYGRIDIKISQPSSDWCLYEMNTSNVIHLSVRPWPCWNLRLKMNGASVRGDDLAAAQGEVVSLWLSGDGMWQASSAVDVPATVERRRRRQLGPLDAILRSEGPFTIRYFGSNTASLALQISRNFFQYFGADTNISLGSIPGNASSTGNEVVIAVGEALPRSAYSEYPIQVAGPRALTIVDHAGQRRRYGGESALAAVFLRPLGNERLELVVWGASVEDAARAARLVPTLTGIGQPDFVLLERSSSWKGLDGAVAMGFLDQKWSVSKTSFVT